MRDAFGIVGDFSEEEESAAWEAPLAGDGAPPVARGASLHLGGERVTEDGLGLGLERCHAATLLMFRAVSTRWGVSASRVLASEGWERRHAGLPSGWREAVNVLARESRQPLAEPPVGHPSRGYSDRAYSVAALLGAQQLKLDPGLGCDENNASQLGSEEGDDDAPPQGSMAFRGVAALLSLNPFLTSLDLSSSAVADPDVVLLASALADNTALTHLDLSYNEPGPTDEGGVALAKALRTNTVLRVLLLSTYIEFGVDQASKQLVMFAVFGSSSSSDRSSRKWIVSCSSPPDGAGRARRACRRTGRQLDPPPARAALPGKEVVRVVRKYVVVCSSSW